MVASPIAMRSPNISGEESKIEEFSLREAKGGGNVIKSGEIKKSEARFGDDNKDEGPFT